MKDHHYVNVHSGHLVKPVGVFYAAACRSDWSHTTGFTVTSV
jgi:hypothetical protein